MDDSREQLSLSLAQHAVRLQMLLDRHVMKVLNGQGLSRAELDVLGALTERGDSGARPSELSSRLLLTTGGLSNVLRRLQSDGLIEREADVTDGRSHTVHLTSRGKSTAHETGVVVTTAIGDALSRVDTSLLDSAAHFLHQVLQALEEDAPVHRNPEPQKQLEPLQTEGLQ